MGPTSENDGQKKQKKRGRRRDGMPKPKGTAAAATALRHLSPLHKVLLIVVALLQWTTTGGRAALLQGCDFSEDLCTDGEVCLPDGLFGQCYSDDESALVRPLVLDRPINGVQSELLRAELTRLAELGLDWPDARAQCVLAYFKLAVAFRLDYDTEFCTVRNPENIWALIQRVQNALLAEAEIERAEEEDEAESLLVNDPRDEALDRGAAAVQGQAQFQTVEDDGREAVEVIPIVVLDGGEGEEEDNEDGRDRMAYEMGGKAEREVPKKTNSKNETKAEKAVDKRTTDTLSATEEAELDQFVHNLLDGRPAAERQMGALSERQLSRLARFIRQLQNVVQNVEETVDEAQEEQLQQEEAPPPLLAEAEAAQPGEEDAVDHVLLLKKDSEQFNNADMGLANTVHKIVKGGIQRVEGNRVYLKVAKEQLTEEELYKLIGYLDKKIAQPNNLYFDEFLYENGQLSFRISRLGVLQPHKDKKDGNADAALENASGVAQAVYKRRKDIQTLAGIRVDETGIGSGVDVVPVERSQRDWLFVPIMAVSAMTIFTLLVVLAANLVRMRRHRQEGPILAHSIAQPGKGGGSVYDDLCRQRIAEEGSISQRISSGRSAGDRSKHSSTSSWPDELSAPTGADQQLDIGTGHVLLAFLKEHMEKPGEVSKEWESVKDYANAAGEATVARRAENAAKNVDATVLPYDDSLVTLHGFNSTETLIDVSSSVADHSPAYYNASKIFDANPEPTYIVAQAPQQNTVATFWQMAWEQGVALLVNLCDKDETTSGRCTQYWPEEGSKMFGNFEVHLVSEHIWSEHYVVRSLYLKNNSTGETRTVTQFHFLSWPGGGMPGSSKALLEFRRKVNKSYRGRASPVLVHCWNGAGRSGCYCLIDIVINRIQKGVKELNIAASLEHLRDQRMGMVENEEQFKFVFSCVAEEISSRLKGLQQQQH
ncbi:hypothetical protein niasHT_007378 [Heterodera trifolii]|uniref:Receptor-type tyrosine-protein phosphatase N2 n=1 Tax=Heterodera trifolii TaxID=157864 RepID=A0ABD2LLG8_9BILA